MPYIGARLKAARTAREMTQDELEERTGIRRTDISAIERDKKPAGAERMRKFADALEVSVLELQPEAEVDERGQLLHDRLTELAATVGDLLERQTKMEREIARLRSRSRTREAQPAAAASGTRRPRGQAAK